MEKKKYYSLRLNCIFCSKILDNCYFEKDYNIPIACYSKDKISDDIIIPYNIFICTNCKTIQTKYLGDLNEIYKVNHADSTGSLMKNLHLTVLSFIKKYKSKINNIVEIGSSKGVLSDLILDNNLVDKYYIIEPNYFGNKRENKIILHDFFENVNFKKYSNANTLIISHVFEHFYEPIKIVEIIQSNSNIKNFFLIWPDLEYYKENSVYHVLNTEHTYYVDNQFIINLLNNFSFKLIEKYKYKGHSVIFIFQRDDDLKKINLFNSNNNIDLYYNKLFESRNLIENFIKENLEKKICMWPASVHTQFLLMFLNNLKIDYILDNSPNKINKFLYGYNIKCLDFKKYINDKDYAIILNGGVFNSEVKKNILNKNILEL
jgi:hypothetical protein